MRIAFESKLGAAMSARRLLTVARDATALARRSRAVVPSDLDQLKPLLHEMRRCLVATGGQGVAAPQFGEHLRLFMLRGPSDFHVLVNPRVLRASRSWTKGWEACLSVPGYAGLVPRPRSVHVAFETLHGEEREQSITGRLARAFQHELDHLNGVLYSERLRPGQSLLEMDGRSPERTFKTYDPER